MPISDTLMTPKAVSAIKNASVGDLYQSVRGRTLEIVAPLEIEDYVIQTADFMSPPRWHIGHTSWFFETVLQAQARLSSLLRGFPLLLQLVLRGFRRTNRTAEARHEVAPDSERNCRLPKAHRRADAFST